MKVNIENCINQIINGLENEQQCADIYGGQIFSLKEFVKNLKELRDRKDILQTHKEFFGIYVFNSEKEKVAKS